ncbi:hypothetical protein ACHAPT_010086 [Fusarium lateritium]
MSSQTEYHHAGRFNHRMASCPPEIPSQPLGVIEEQLGNANDHGTASAAAHPPHHLQPDQATNSINYNHEHQLQDQEVRDDWTVEEILRVEQENNQAIIQGIRAANAGDRSALKELMGQNLANFGQGCQQIMNFLTDWAKRFSQHQLVAKVATLEEKLQQANQRYQQLATYCKETRAKCNDATAKLEEANTKLDQALRERDEQRRLVDGGTLANSIKATDDAVLSKWRVLGYNIRMLACFLAKEHPSYPLDQAVLHRLRFVSPSPRKHLGDDDYRDLVIQGYLWDMVNEKILDANFRTWGGPGVSSLKNLKDFIINRINASDDDPGAPTYPIQQAARWFVQGSSILNQLWGSQPQHLADLINAETQLLRPFFLPRHASLDGQDKKVREELKAIMEVAVEIDQMLMCSKAIFQIHWNDACQNPSKSQRFNSEVMDALCHERVLSPESRVTMVVSPMLFKIGNADGQNYDSRMLLAKATVVCE